MTTANDLPVLELLPAVDVVNGQAVRLVQGEAGSETSYGTPLEAALNWQQQGAEWVHLVDLDAAFGRGSNAELLREVVGRLDIKVELSGGLRDDESLEAALDLGVARVNLGTAALENPEWTAPGHRPLWRQDRRRTRRPRNHAGRPRLDQGRRRPLGGPGPPRRSRLRPLRGHGRHQGRHPAGTQR